MPSPFDPPDNIAHFVKSRVDYRLGDTWLKFDTSLSLFSSDSVDVGSALLLRTMLRESVAPVERALDLGCGYGVIGLSLRAAGMAERVDLVDRDALAVEFSRANAVLNELDGTETFGSLDYLDIPPWTRYALIVSNIPGKAGEPAIERWLLEAQRFLTGDGKVFIVIVAPLADFVAEVLSRPGIEIVYRKDERRYSVFSYTFTGRPEPGIEENAGVEILPTRYQRGIAGRSYKRLAWEIVSARGLPDFDSLSFSVQVFLKELTRADIPNRLVVHLFNPEQGDTAIAVASLKGLSRLAISARDSLALRATRHNLAHNGVWRDDFVLVHQPGLMAPSDFPQPGLVAGVLYDDPQPAVTGEFEKALDSLGTGGSIIVAGKSTPVTRLVKQFEKRLRVVNRDRLKGHSSLHAVKTR